MRKLFNDFADKHFPYRKRRIINKNMPEILDAIMINAKFEELGISPIEELDIDVAGHDDLFELKYLLSELLHYPSPRANSTLSSFPRNYF